MTDTRLMHEVGVKALDWLYTHREGFRTRRGPETTDREAKERLKPIGELAMIGKVLFREGVAGSQQAEHTRRLLDFAWQDLLDGGQALVRMQRQEPLSPIPLEMYAPFKELGYRCPPLESALTYTTRLRSWPPDAHIVRRLGIARLQDRVGLGPGGDFDRILRETWLGRTPEPWSVESNIGYDITHTVYHVTDWGENPDNLPPDIADYLMLWLPAWMDNWAEIGNWDLLGELLVVDACLPTPALDEDVWRRFAQAQRPDGLVPARAGADLGEDHWETFDLHYHPTLVAAFAAVLSTSRAMAGLTSAS
ncbi:DUF6895 family protein [Embleya sp. AB8]|uniref:DUF6895 family protein n=1 Tax=Embleya sp. AB8 TaxID=3156304 RepID=UPI003C76C836